jgi:hypothetical protein
MHLAVQATPMCRRTAPQHTDSYCLALPTIYHLRLLACHQYLSQLGSAKGVLPRGVVVYTAAHAA